MASWGVGKMVSDMGKTTKGRTGWDRFVNGPDIPEPPEMDPEYSKMNDAALAMLRRWASGEGMPTGEAAGQGMYDTSKAALDKSLSEQKKFNAEDAARRGIYNSGILSSNQNKAYEAYSSELSKAAAQKQAYKDQVAQYSQGVRQNAIQALLGYVPPSVQRQNMKYQGQLMKWGNQQSTLEHILGIAGIGASIFMK